MNIDDEPTALGTVVDGERGSLPFLLIHGESLVACAAWALGAARVTTVGFGTPWAALVDTGQPFVLHDPLCPMTPVDFIAACVSECLDTGAVVAAVDDRGAVLSPVVLPTAVVGRLTSLPSTNLDALVRLLGSDSEVVRRVAPAAAARITSAEDVAALELLTAPVVT